jgi:hypothetical protein
MNDGKHLLYQASRLRHEVVVVVRQGKQHELGDPGAVILGTAANDVIYSPFDHEIISGKSGIRRHRCPGRHQSKGKARTIVIVIDGPTRFRGGQLDCIHHGLHLAGRLNSGHPTGPERRGPRNRRLTTPTDPQRQRLLYRTRRNRRAIETVELPFGYRQVNLRSWTGAIQTGLKKPEKRHQAALLTLLS